MKKHAPLAALLTLCVIALGIRWLILTKGSVSDSRPIPERSLSVHEVSIAVSRYVAEFGEPKMGPDTNRDMTRLLLDAGFISPHHIADGNLVDDWGTPYAVFLCEEPGKFANSTSTINGQTVRPIQGVRPPLMHQIISAGPDGRFATEDDIYSWKSPSDW